MNTAPVSVIIPCFNEEAGLPALLSQLDLLHQNGGRGWLFFFVDDGSTDDTFAALLQASRHRQWVQVIRQAENLGLGAALRTGLANVDSPIICTIDSDCTYPPEKLPQLVELVEQGADLATASAWHPGSVPAEGSAVRLRLSRAVSSIYKLLIGQDVYTFTCLFRAYRRDTIKSIRFRTNGFAAVAEIMLRAILAGRRVAELPMKLERRRFGESKLKIGDAIAAHSSLLSMTAVMVAARKAAGANRTHKTKG